MLAVYSFTSTKQWNHRNLELPETFDLKVRRVEFWLKVPGEDPIEYHSNRPIRYIPLPARILNLLLHIRSLPANSPNAKRTSVRRINILNGHPPCICPIIYTCSSSHPCTMFGRSILDRLGTEQDTDRWKFVRSTETGSCKCMEKYIYVQRMGGVADIPILQHWIFSSWGIDLATGHISTNFTNPTCSFRWKWGV